MHTLTVYTTRLSFYSVIFFRTSVLARYVDGNHGKVFLVSLRQQLESDLGLRDVESSGVTECSGLQRCPCKLRFSDPRIHLSMKFNKMPGHRPTPVLHSIPVIPFQYSIPELPHSGPLNADTPLGHLL